MEPRTSQQAESNRASPSRLIGTMFAWILTIFLLMVFTFAGAAKLINNPGMVREFAQIGLGQWFRYFTGILEVSGAIGLLIPNVRFCAALQIALVMTGATLANLTVLHLPVMARVRGVLLVLALALAWLRRPKSGPQPQLASAF
jgi:putative oxidoreductase